MQKLGPEVFRPVSLVSGAFVWAACAVTILAAPSRAQSLDDGVERYRSSLVADVDRTLAGIAALRARAGAGDVEGAKQAWIEARAGWERSEVFTTGFVPELDQKIDAWPNGTQGFHGIEATLFGAGETDFATHLDALERNLDDLRDQARTMALTPQGLFGGMVRLAYEVGDSKAAGGESRVSGTSLFDMRNNVDGIELAYGTIFAPALAALNHDLDADVKLSIGGLKRMVSVSDLRRVDPDALQTATEDLVLKLQKAGPILQLQQATLESTSAK